jgi:hypothetical protein
LLVSELYRDREGVELNETLFCSLQMKDDFDIDVDTDTTTLTTTTTINNNNNGQCLKYQSRLWVYINVNDP